MNANNSFNSGDSRRQLHTPGLYGRRLHRYHKTNFRISKPRDIHKRTWITTPPFATRNSHTPLATATKQLATTQLVTATLHATYDCNYATREFVRNLRLQLCNLRLQLVTATFYATCDCDLICNLQLQLFMHLAKLVTAT